MGIISTIIKSVMAEWLGSLIFKGTGSDPELGRAFWKYNHWSCKKFCRKLVAYQVCN